MESHLENVLDACCSFMDRRSDNMKYEPNQQEYEEYVEEITPKHNLLVNCSKAFFTGGSICLFGEILKQICLKYFKLETKDALIVVILILVFLSVILTGFNLYGKITKFGGAGALVPITGFANSVASPTIEYQKEGQVFGIGVKIFSIAGPVILYGIFSSFVVGVIYYLMEVIGG